MKRDRLPKSLADALPLANADDHRIDLTKNERVMRRCFAIHEGAHFVTACRIELYPFDAYVRVPRKSPNALSVFRAGGPGVGGLVSVSGTLMQDAVIAAAAVIAQLHLPNAHERIYADDMATTQKWFDADSAPDQEKEAFLDAVAAIVEREWQVIDAVAACLLHCADSTGYLSPKLTARLSQLVRYAPSGIIRAPEFRFWSPLREIPVSACPTIAVIRESPYVSLCAKPNYKSSIFTSA
jgi:hypothetical protein